MDREPVLIYVVVPALLTQLGTAAGLLASNHTTAGILLAVSGFLTGLGGALARAKVVPVS